jgi:hypothetical protein
MWGKGRRRTGVGEPGEDHQDPEYHPIRTDERTGTMELIVFLVVFLICWGMVIVIGALLGMTKGRIVEGALLAAVLGVIDWIITLVAFRDIRPRCPACMTLLPVGARRCFACQENLPAPVAKPKQISQALPPRIAPLVIGLVGAVPTLGFFLQAVSDWFSASAGSTRASDCALSCVVFFVLLVIFLPITGFGVLVMAKSRHIELNAPPRVNGARKSQRLGVGRSV